MALTEIPSELSSTPSIVDNGNATAITIDSSEDVTLAGNILHAGDLTLDAAGKIILDGDEAGATVHLKDGGVHWGSIYRSSSNFNIKSETQDKDIVFLGNDGGSTITALTLDMSAAGAATFNSTVTANVARTSSSSATVLTLKDNVTGAQTNGVYKAIRSESNGTSSVSEIRFIESDGTNNNTAIGFATAASAGAISEKMRIHPGGVVSFLSGIELGSGLDATAANTLDYYETGTWTPTLAGYYGTYGISISQGSRIGKYTRVGNLVTLSMEINNAGVAASGNGDIFVITALPFAIGSPCVGSHAHTSIASFVGGGWTAINNTQLGHLGNNGAANNAWTWLTGANVATAGVAIRLTITYRAA